MKKTSSLIVIIIVVLLMPVMVLGQSSPPAIPLLVYGSVTVDGNLAPVGTIITAEIDNVEVVSFEVLTEGIYFVGIPDGQANEGKMIIFKVIGITDEDNQCEALNIATYPIVNLNLAVTSPSSPPPSPPPSPSPGGGGSITQTPPTPPTPLSEAAQVVDTNEDDKIDILDFNSLVINWGSTESDNIADFDNSGIVDIFDFNLLMTYWTG